MTQSKGSFTPGPWLVRTLENFGFNVVHYRNGDKHDIARVAKCSVEADARLIAAAPALLEALKRTTELLANANRSTDRPSDNVWLAVSEARAAIQSATGEG